MNAQNQNTARTDRDDDREESLPESPLIPTAVSKNKGWLAIVAAATLLFGAGLAHISRGQTEHLAGAFGVANAVLSGLAFAVLIVALETQQRELELQRKELRLQRKEYRKSREAQTAMAAAQEESERRLLLTAYLNAVETYRQVEEARRGPVPNEPDSRTLRSLVAMAEVSERLVPVFNLAASRLGDEFTVRGGSTVWLCKKLLEIHDAVHTGYVNSDRRPDVERKQLTTNIRRLCEDILERLPPTARLKMQAFLKEIPSESESVANVQSHFEGMNNASRKHILTAVRELV